jgi:methionine-rich copper-binding protein CopC
VALAIAAMALAALVAGAHARLDESAPAVGEVLAASPPQVSITFTQDVQKISGTYGIDVIDAGGADLTTADAVLNDDDRRIMTVDLQPSLPAGRYIVEYKNVSDEDGDPFAGAYAFYVGREPTAEELAADHELLGEEEETPTAEATPAPTAVATPVSVPTPVTNGDDDDAGGTITLILVVGAIALVATLVIAGFVALSRRRAGS